MGQITLATSPMFPDGTSVGVYGANGSSNWPGSPPGAVVKSGTATAGAVTFTTLAVGSYFAAAQVNGAWRAISFAISPSVPATEYFSTEAVTTGNATTPSGTSIFRIDPTGSVLSGPNKLIKDGSQQDLVGWDPLRSAPDQIYDAVTRRSYGRSAFYTEVGDAVDHTLGRFGANNAYPDGLTGTADGLTGVPAGTSVGKYAFRAGVTPDGGTPDVTGGSYLSSRFAAIYGRTGEIFSGTAQGGHLVFQTTPLGSTTIRDVGRFNADGDFELGPNFDAKLRSSSGVVKTDTGFETAGTDGFFASNTAASPAFRAVLPAGSTLIRNRLLSTDTQSAFAILGDGRIQWGPGGTTAPDITLQRKAADYLAFSKPIGTTAVVAPADGSLAASQVAFYLDDTNGAGKLMIKAKTANGTVATGSVSLT